MQGWARPVAVIDLYRPLNTTAVLFDEDFVTVSVLSERLEAARAEAVNIHALHRKVMRKIASSHTLINRCNLGYDENKESYFCHNWHVGLCIGFFPEGMADRVTEVDRCIQYSCPTCTQCFAKLP